MADTKDTSGTVAISPRSLPKQFQERLGIDWLWWREDDVGGFGGDSFGPVRDLFDACGTILQNVPDGKRGNVIQAGGNCGLYARWYAQHFNRVFTFEPTRGNFKALAMNAVEVPNVWAYNCALGNLVDGFADRKATHADNCGADSYKVGNEQSHTPVIALDNIAINWGRIDVIHLDVEGFEPLILDGAQQILERDHPIVIVENPQNTIAVLKSMGYKEKERVHSDQIFVWEG